MQVCSSRIVSVADSPLKELSLAAAYTDCAVASPTCQYQLDGSISFVTGPLPCSNGRTWTFIAADSPSADGQVACSAPGMTELSATFSATTMTCSDSTTATNNNVTVSVAAQGNTCTAQLSLGTYTGKKVSTSYTTVLARVGYVYQATNK
jgi:hypothetical protein